MTAIMRRAWQSILFLGSETHFLNSQAQGGATHMLKGLISTLCELRNEAQIGLWELNLRRAEITFFPGPTIGACGKRSIPLRLFRRLLHPLDRALCSMALAQLLIDGKLPSAPSVRIRSALGGWQPVTLSGRIADYAHDGAALSIVGMCSHPVVHRVEGSCREGGSYSG